MSGENQGPDMYFAGGECLDRFGVLVRRTDVDLEEATQETATRNSVAKAMGRDSILREAKIDIPRVNWINEIDVEATRNLLDQSEQLIPPPWTTARASVVTEVATAPDLELTADKVVEDTAVGSTHYVRQTADVPNNETVTLSAFVKPAGRPGVELLVADAGLANSASVRFPDLVNGTALTTGSGFVVVNFGSTPIGGGWFRLFVVVTVTGTSARVQIQLNDGTTSAYTGDGESGLFVWGTQLEVATAATDYQSTPRDQEAKTPSLYLEDAATNLGHDSEEMDNVSWAKAAASIKPNLTIAPNGVASGDIITEDSTNNSHNTTQTADAVVAGTVHTISVYARIIGRSIIFVADAAGNEGGAFFDLAAGTVGSTQGSGFISARIERIGDGTWHRCFMTYTPPGTSVSPRFAPAATDGAVVYLGDGRDSLGLWGAQLETGAVGTSYVPTGGVAASRAADLFLTPFPHQLQPLSVYAKFLDDGTGLASAGLWLIGGSSGPTLFVLHSSTGYQFIHRAANFVDSFSTSGNPTTPGPGTLIETNSVLYPDGSVQIDEVFEGETFVGPVSGTNPLVSTFGLSNVSINSRDIIVGSATGFSRFLALKIQRGVRSLDFMRAL